MTPSPFNPTITQAQKKDLSFCLRDVGVTVTRLENEAYPSQVLKPEINAIKQALEKARITLNELKTA